MIELLLRCYPARWRARFGDEFATLLGERPISPFDVADVLLGALDAHLHFRDPATSVPGKGFAMTLRIGGYAAILGGLLWSTVLAGNAINDGDESGVFWIGLVLLAAIISTLVALIGLSAFQARRFPLLIWTAFAVPAVGAILALIGVVAMVATGDSDREIVAGFSGWAISTIGVVALLLGSGLFALATWRARSLSRGAAALLGVGAILVLPGLTGLSGGIVPEAVAGIALLVTLLAFPAGWAALGVSALRADGNETAHAGGAVA